MLESSQRAVQEKEKKVEELDKLLNKSMDDLQQKDKDLQDKESKMAELDQTLRERQWELKQKAAQVRSRTCHEACRRVEFLQNVRRSMAFQVWLI